MHLDAGNARFKLPYAHQVANVSLEAGQLVIFPSWVMHDVKPFEGEGERITIAFNCWFLLPEAETGGAPPRNQGS
jgi:predicted 2-oxoglutarate/Fe(II)-dependent dioxygenase YbiX